MKFNENLAFIRKSNSLSQEQLAEKLNISRQAVSKWESGASSPDPDTLIKLCEILNVSTEQLLIDYKSSTNVPRKTILKKADLLAVLFYIFLMLIFLSGVLIFVLNFFGNNFEPSLTWLSLSLIFLSFISFIIIFAKIGKKNSK